MSGVGAQFADYSCRDLLPVFLLGEFSPSINTAATTFIADFLSFCGIVGVITTSIEPDVFELAIFGISASTTFLTMLRYGSF